MTPEEFAEECRICNSPQRAMELLKSAEALVEGNQRLTGIAYRMKERLEQYIAAYSQQKEDIEQYKKQQISLENRIADLESELEKKQIELELLKQLEQLGQLSTQIGRIEAAAERIEAIPNKAEKPAPARKRSAPKSKKEPSKKYGEYKHVQLTDQQYVRLVNEFGDWKTNEYIRKVDEYCQQHGKTYKDYNLTIRNFIRDDNNSVAVNSTDTGEHSYDINKYLEYAENHVPTVNKESKK